MTQGFSEADWTRSNSGSFQWRTGGPAWTVNRLGQSAAAITYPGTPPAYGTAFDLASASAITSEQFTDFARTMAQVAQRPVIDLAARNIPVDQHERELQIATNFERLGLSMADDTFANTDDDDEGWLTRFGNDLITGFRMARNKIGQGFHEAGELIGLNEDEAPDYDTYAEHGGTLTESEWNSFSPTTRNQLFDRANVGRTVEHVASAPGISQGLYLIDLGYRSAITTGDVLKDSRARLFGDESTGSFWNDLTMTFDKSEWAENWRASDDRSLGNVILDNLLIPKVSQDTLDEWRKHNSWYQMSSVGAEFAATWHMDIGVQGLKAAGDLARFARREMPLRETGAMYSAIREAQAKADNALYRPEDAREIISVRSAPAKKYAEWQAKRTTEGFAGLIDYAKATKDDFRQFAELNAFHGRAADGVAAAKAIHIAANSGDDKLIDLTRGALNGDLRALRTIQEMKEDPSKAARFTNGTNFVQAYDAVKLKANQFDDEIAKLQERKAKLDLNEHSFEGRFARWEVDTDLATKQKELGEMRAWLEADSDYMDWLSSIGTTPARKSLPGDAANVDPFNPQLERYSAPKTKWNDQTERFELSPRVRHFHPDIFTHGHTKLHVTPAIMARKIGVVNMHDIDSGGRAVNRFFNQVQSVLDFDDVDNALRNEYHGRWAKTAGAQDKYGAYLSMYEMEENVLVPALANKLGISEGTARAVFNKINEERGRTFEGLTNGKGRIYDTAPTFAQRLQDETGATARVVSDVDAKGAPIPNDEGMVTIEFRDGQRLVTAEVPEGMLTPRVKPVDVTQTPNYYQPADVWRLYHEMKRHRDTLAELDELLVGRRGGIGGAIDDISSFARHDKANLMEINEILATKFYSFWKPLQLWRLGWPQRVLMDEGFRAMAIFGPMYWITGPGAESVGTAIHNTPAFIREKYRAGKYGSIAMAEGPSKPQTRAASAFAQQQQAATAVRLPAEHFPKVNKDRYAHAQKVNTATGSAVAARNKFYAVERQAGRDVNPTSDPAVLDHPLMRAMADQHEGVRIYDPISGKRVSKGYFVPMPNLSHKLTGEWPYSENNLLRWYEDNSELLARRGIRIQVDGDNVQIGQWFDSKGRRRAEESMRAAARSKPTGEQTHKAFDLSDGSEFEIVQLDSPDPSTMFDEDLLEAQAGSDLLNAPVREFESISEAFEAFDEAINMPLKKKDFGTGRAMFVSHGKTYYVDEVFEGHLGRLTRGLTSSAPAMDNLTDAHTAALGMMRHRAAGHVRIHAPEFTPETLKVGTKAYKKAVLYFQRYADLMNNQVANSPVWGPMLKGAKDEDIVRYLKEDPKGYKHRMEVLEPHESVEMYVNEMRAKLDYYLPSHELRRRLADNPITASDIRRKVHNDDLPDIYGPDLTLEDKGFLRAVADNVWNALGTIPADKFSRQPFAKAVYNQKVRSLLNQSDAKFLDEAALTRIHQMAANHTREQIRQHLFDLTDGSNMTNALRFIAPFWGAQEEAIVKWAKIISDRPETVARFFAGQRAIYNNLLVLDEENEPVPLNRPGGSFFDVGFGYHPTDKMILQVPDVVRKTPYLGEALKNIGSVGIPLGSANTVLQGDLPLLPSFGPWMTIPADKFMRAWSDTHGVEYKDTAMYRWLFPIGRPQGGTKGILEQLFPGWGRRAMGATGAEDDVAHANLYMQMAREMTLRNQRKGLAPPTPQEVEAAADMLWGARMVAAFASPVQLEFRPINQMFADEAHRYKREYGADWETKFFEDFGEEAMIYAVSSSHSLAGIPPTSAGVNAWDANKELIAKYPEFGGLIVGSDTYLDEFNHDAYEMQFEKNLGPGDSRTLRDLTDPRERIAQAEESIGWIKFRKIDATVQAELYARGLTNIQQTGAEDIARYRTDALSQLYREYPAWAGAYKTLEQTIYEKVEQLSEIARRREFDGRVDIQGLRDYLTIRDQVAQQLDIGYANGYASRNLQAQENFALRNWFYNAVGTLVQDNPAFGELYSRYLSQDKLEQGSGGYGG